MKKSVRTYYSLFSKLYDYGFGIGSLWLMGKLQKESVATLGLRRGDSVYDLGCGSGLLLKHLVAAVGEEGKVIGVDFSDGMLDKARAIVARHGWKNVELICADLTAYQPRQQADAAIFCLTLSLIPEAEKVVANTVPFVKPGKPIVITDSWRLHRKWYHRLTNAFQRFKAPIVCSIYTNRLGEIIPAYLKNVTFKEKFFGIYSIAKGER